MCVQLSHFAVQQKLLKYCNQLFFNKIKKKLKSIAFLI